MDDQEVNKIIAEFDSDTQRTYKCKDGKILVQDYITLKWHDTGLKEYTKSLDALVPVWGGLKEKSYILDYKILPMVSDSFTCVIRRLDDSGEYFNEIVDAKKTKVTQAAAHATAKAILELERE